MEDKIEIHRGLKGVYFDRSATSLIDGKRGELSYYGYSIHDLAQHSTFEEVVYLLLHGELPTQTQLASTIEQLQAARKLPEHIVSLITSLKSAHPMEVLRTAVSALEADDPDRADKSPDAMGRKGLRLCSQLVSIAGTHAAQRENREIAVPVNSVTHAGFVLEMITGKEPSTAAALLMDKDLILHAEHGSNASTFVARVVIGTEASFHGAITAAVAALSGAAHGGAAEDVMRMAMEIGSPENAAAYVKNARASGIAVTGFGHRVYRTEDPRARHMRDGLKNMAAETGGTKWLEILQAVVEEMKPYARFGVHVNVDFYSGVTYYLNGIPPDMFVPLFAMGRMPGWTAQCLEQQQSNILIRPLTEYNGPAPRSYVPIEQR